MSYEQTHIKKYANKFIKPKTQKNAIYWSYYFFLDKNLQTKIGSKKMEWQEKLNIIEIQKNNLI